MSPAFPLAPPLPTHARRWGVPSSKTGAQFVVQPYTRPGNLKRWSLAKATRKGGSRGPLGGGDCNQGDGPPPFNGAQWNEITCVMQWYSGLLRWYCFDGLWDVNQLAQGGKSLLTAWQYWDMSRIPTPGTEKVHFNLWQANTASGGIPATGRRQHVVIAGFSHTPDWVELGNVYGHGERQLLTAPPAAAFVAAQSTPPDSTSSSEPDPLVLLLEELRAAGAPEYMLLQVTSIAALSGLVEASQAHRKRLATWLLAMPSHENGSVGDLIIAPGNKKPQARWWRALMRRLSRSHRNESPLITRGTRKGGLPFFVQQPLLVTSHTRDYPLYAVLMGSTLFALAACQLMLSAVVRCALHLQSHKATVEATSPQDNMSPLQDNTPLQRLRERAADAATQTLCLATEAPGKTSILTGGMATPDAASISVMTITRRPGAHKAPEPLPLSELSLRRTQRGPALSDGDDILPRVPRFYSPQGVGLRSFSPGSPASPSTPVHARVSGADCSAPRA